MFTFVCEQCGASGAVPAPGAARCRACGYVALVEGPPGWRASPKPDPFAALSPERARAANAVNGRRVGATERRATLWIPPGPQEVPAPDPSPAASTRRPRALYRTAIAGALAGSAALALAAAVAVVPRWLDAESTDAPAPAPVQQPAPSPVPPATLGEPSAPAAAAKPPRAVPARRALATASRQSPEAVPNRALVNPAPVDRRCVPRALRARRDVAHRLPGEIAVRLRITASGDVARIEVPGVADRDLADAIADAVRNCRFSPGTDEEGRPVALPIVMRIRFASAEAAAGF